MALRYRRLSILAILALTLLPLASNSQPIVHAVSNSQTPHGQIYITNNTQFTAANGVTGGNGTKASPYVISGWRFDPSTVPSSSPNFHPTAIDIRYTSVFFVIRNVVVDGVGVGISFLWVVNARITNTTVSNNLEGIDLTDSVSDIVDNNTAVGNQEGIYMIDSSYLTISNNLIVATSSQGITTQGYQTKNITIVQNTLNGNSWAIVVGGARNTTVTHNQLFSNSLGVDVDSSSGTWIVENNFLSGVQWIATHFGGVTHVFHNNFGDRINTSGGYGGGGGGPSVYIDTSSTVLLDNGYPSGGNHWSDYLGVDRCSGPKQDLCTGSDGIGDTPYMVDFVNGDHYPLMRPFGPQPAHAPEWPLGSVLSASNVQSTSLVLSWPFAKGAVEYTVQEQGVSIANVSATSFTVTGLTIGATYHFKVEAGDFWDNYSRDGPGLSVRVLPQGAYLGVESLYSGPPYQGGSTVILNNFTSLGQDPIRVLSLSLSGDLGTSTLSGLPIVLSSGENVRLNMTLSIPKMAFVGRHTVTVSVSWQYFSPGNATWTNAPPLTFTGYVPVYLTTPPSTGPSGPSSPPSQSSSTRTSTKTQGILGQLFGWVEPLWLGLGVAYLVLLVGGIVLLARRSGRRDSGSNQQVCPRCRTPAGPFSLYCGHCGFTLQASRD